MSNFRTVVLALALCLTIPVLAAVASKVWCCRYCGDVEELDKRPDGGKCSARNAPHGWEHIGEPGTKRFKCSKCGVQVKVRISAKSTGCPKGGSHSWKSN